MVKIKFLTLLNRNPREMVAKAIIILIAIVASLTLSTYAFPWTQPKGGLMITVMSF